MYRMIRSGAVVGVSAYPVTVEVDIAMGLPVFSMVGSLGTEVRESKERVMVALKNIGLNLPPRHITVNLSPGDVKKEGTAFDLPIVVGILSAMEVFPEKATEDILFLGELGLDGEVKKVKGVLPIVRDAARRGIRECIVPMANAKEGAVIPEIVVRGCSHISEVMRFLTETDVAKREECLPRELVDVDELMRKDRAGGAADFSEVNGQETAKRASEIAAAGFHNLLMVGPPGAGKSMIAKRIPGIMPPLNLEESLEVTSIYSVAGRLEEGACLISARPFQSPHHTITQAALAGGCGIPKPGMISLAHRGVLFLDELPEFKRDVLDCLRQPIEDKKIHIARSSGTVTYPSDFMLVCAMNPCLCGYYPDRNRCTCTEPQIKRYMGRISGPILDRIDLCVELQPVEIKNLNGTNKTETTAQIRERVLAVRQVQEERFCDTPIRFNGDMDAPMVAKYCVLGEKEQKFMEQLYNSLQLSARSYHRLLKVARTIADLDGEEKIREEHLLEASYYRPSTEYWM